MFIFLFNFLGFGIFFTCLPAGRDQLEIRSIRLIHTYSSPLQLLAGVYPAFLASSVELNHILFFSAICDAPAHQGKWYFVPFFEATSIPLDGRLETTLAVDKLTFFGTSSFVIIDFGLFFDISESLPRPNEPKAMRIIIVISKNSLDLHFLILSSV